ncbi:MAG: GTP 3',8-cyclase MoaA [Candidatus Zixiibacteriota bacterium]|nr:MAG: GTP 3',8-cyclase MoaA [candidate division Zixibacteria bacterium]
MILKDIYGRSISYLRVSLTEKCNLKCGYCYGGPGNGGVLKPQLSDDALFKLIKAFSFMGIDKIRYTGGEPLLRERVADMIKETSKIESFKIIGLTTNGVLLGPRLDSLVGAGLNRLNISLDSLDRKTYAGITGKDCLGSILDAIDLALQYDVFGHIKINIVVMRGINHNEAPRFAEWALDKKIDLRFIEFMPGYKSGWGEELFVGEDEIKKRIGIKLDPLSIGESNSGPAKSFRYGDYPGRISFISAVSRGFCVNCNRLRLTSKGDLVGCLFDSKSVNLGAVVENSDSIEEIASVLKKIFAEQLYRKSPDVKIINGCEPSMRKIGG